MARRPRTEVKQVDASGRISLGKEDAHRTFAVERRPDGSVLFTPVKIIPEREAWLWSNPEALAAVREGLSQSKKGERKHIGSFSQYAEDEIED